MTHLYDPEGMHRTYEIHISKRILDIVCSCIILLATLPVTVLALVGIKIEHVLRGRPLDPFFYCEIRISQGKQFSLCKFNIFKHEKILELRSKKICTNTKRLEKNGGIIFVGWILRQTYMDELPQLFSVLRGDMSIVGPRPVNLEVYEKQLQQGIFNKKMLRAGITGNYQSMKSHKIDANLYDKEYVDYCLSKPWYKVLLFDIRIMLRTLKVILLAKGI